MSATASKASHRLVKPVIPVLLVLTMIDVAVWAAWSRIAVQLASKKQAAKTAKPRMMINSEFSCTVCHQQ